MDDSIDGNNWNYIDNYVDIWNGFIIKNKKI